MLFPNLYPALQLVQDPDVVTHAEQPVHEEQEAVVPPVEYVNDAHAVHLPLANLYPALHVVQTPVVVAHAEHPVH